MLASGEINSLSAVPTLLRILLAAPALVKDSGHRLRWLEIGSQSMSAREKQEIRRMFPAARIVQHYGMTEASRCTFLQISEATEESLSSVGMPTGATRIQVVEGGRIRVRGPHVAQWRITADGLSGIPTSDGWLDTGDLGYMENDHLFFTGRADERINCAGVKIQPETLEDRLAPRMDGQQIVVVRVPDELRGDGVLIVATPGVHCQTTVRRMGRESLREIGGPDGALHVWIRDDIPRTTTGKPRRGVLREEFIRRQG